VQQLLPMIYSAAQAQVIRVAAALGIADLIKDSPKSATELAEATTTQEATMARLMRTLTGLGLVTVTESGRSVHVFSRGRVITNRSPLFAAPLCPPDQHGPGVPAWPTFLDSLRTGQSGFEQTLGTPFYASVQQHPDEVALLSPAMTEMSRQEATAIQQVYDFSACHTVVDVGGGQGFMLAHLLQAHPALHGILLDLPSVVAGAQTWLQPYVVSNRCRVLGGIFCRRCPLEGICISSSGS